MGSQRWRGDRRGGMSVGAFLVAAVVFLLLVGAVAWLLIYRPVGDDFGPIAEFDKAETFGNETHVRIGQTFSSEGGLSQFKFGIRHASGPNSNFTWWHSSLFGDVVVLDMEDVSAIDLPEIDRLVCYDALHDSKFGYGDFLSVQFHERIPEDDQYTMVICGMRAGSWSVLDSIGFSTEDMTEYPRVSTKSESTTGDDSRLTFGEYHGLIGASELRISLRNDTLGSEGQNVTWATSSSVDGAIFQSIGSPAEMPEVLSITYHDLLNDGRVQAGDSINIHLRAHVQTLQFHLILTDVAGGTVRILTLWFAGNGSVPIPISPQVPFADAIVLEKQIHISFGNVSEARGIAEFLVYIEDVTPGTFWTSSQWRSAVNNSSNLAFCGDGPNPLSHIASLTYRDIMENGRIDQGDELHLTLSDSTPVGHTYRIALRLTSNGSWGASVDFVFDGQ